MLYVCIVSLYWKSFLSKFIWRSLRRCSSGLLGSGFRLRMEHIAASPMVLSMFVYIELTSRDIRYEWGGTVWYQ